MARRKPPPPKHNALVASAAVMAQHPDSMMKMRTADWQNDAWDFYDTVGELRFAVGWLANGMSRVNLVAARHPEFQGDEPSAILVPDPADVAADPERALSPIEALAVDLVSAIAGGPDGQGAMLAQLATYLSVPGIGWVLMEAQPNPLLNPLDDPAFREPDDLTPPAPDQSWTWRVLSSDELRVQGEVYEVADGPGSWRPVVPEHVLVRVWRPHPRRQWEPDSPCRAVLGVLRQITLLDEHVQATAQSRLAGAGILVLPSEVEFAPVMNLAPVPESTADGDQPVVVDSFTETLVTTMTIPIGDRGSAAAVVPLVVRVPGEYVDKVNHITFWSEFQDNVLPLRDSAVKRLALGIDLPPEVLTGMAGMNHWGAWQVEETAITLHIEPMAETICDAATTGYLQAGLRAAGFSEAEADEFIVWYDTTDLTTRPDRSADAISVYDRLELSAAALRRETGLSEDDAPDETEFRRRVLLQAASGAPTLAPMMLAEAGLMAPAVADAAAAVPDTGTPAAPGSGTPPPPPPDQGPPPEQQSATTLEACDALVHRALERAGTRLQSRVGRKANGGAATVACPDPALMHTTVKATDHGSLDFLLANAWTRVPDVADRLGYDAEALTLTLDSYTRALLATGHAHDRDRLSDALGLTVSR